MSQPPPPTERVFLTDPSPMPALLAVGIAALVVGLFAWWPYAVAGAALALFSLIGWLRANRRDLARMPTKQQTDTAPLPLSGRE